MSFDLKIKSGDIAIDSTGDVALVTDNNKLKQDIIKIMLTKLGENKYHPQYGSKVGSLEIGHIPDKELLELDLKVSADAAIRKLMSLQREQSKTQYVSAGETIAGIQNISVLQDDQDPRQYQITVSILTRKLTIIEETFSLQV